MSESESMLDRAKQLEEPEVHGTEAWADGHHLQELTKKHHDKLLKKVTLQAGEMVLPYNRPILISLEALHKMVGPLSCPRISVTWGIQDMGGTQSWSTITGRAASVNGQFNTGIQVGESQDFPEGGSAFSIARRPGSTGRDSSPGAASYLEEFKSPAITKAGRVRQRSSRNQKDLSLSVGLLGY